MGKDLNVFNVKTANIGELREHIKLLEAAREDLSYKLTAAINTLREWERKLPRPGEVIACPCIIECPCGRNIKAFVEVSDQRYSDTKKLA